MPDIGGSHVGLFPVLTPLEQQQRVQEADARALTLQAAVEKRKQEIAQAQQHQQIMGFLQDSIKRHMDPNSGMPDFDAVESEAWQNLPPDAAQLVSKENQDRKKATVEAGIQDLKKQQESMKTGMDLLNRVNDQGSFAVYLPQIRKVDPLLANSLGTEFDPDLKDRILRGAMSHTDQLKDAELAFGKDPQLGFLHSLNLADDPDEWEATFKAAGRVLPTSVIQTWRDQYGAFSPQSKARVAADIAAAKQGGSDKRTQAEAFEDDFLAAGAAKLKKTVDQLTPSERVKLKTEARFAFEAAGRAPVEGQGWPVPVADPNAPHGDDFLKTVSPQRAAVIKSLAEGRQPWPTGAAMRSDYWQKLANDVFQYDPTFDTATASNNARVKVRQDFTSGKSAETIRALNQVVGHINQLDKLTDALHNRDSKLYNTIANSILSNTTAWTGQNDYETVVGHVAEELTKLWRNTGGSAEDIKRELATLDSNKPPAVLHSAIRNLIGLVESAQDSLKEKQKQGLGLAANIDTASPESQAIIDRIQGRTGSTGKFSVTDPNGKVHTFDTQAQADAFKKAIGGK